MLTRVELRTRSTAVAEKEPIVLKSYSYYSIKVDLK